MPAFHDPGEPRRDRRARLHARREAAYRRLARTLTPYPGRADDHVDVPLDPPEAVGFVRSFVPAVAETHPLHGPLSELLRWVDRTWYDTDKAFPVSKKRRRRRRRRHPTQTLRTIPRHAVIGGGPGAVPRRLHGLLAPAPPELGPDGAWRDRGFRVADPRWYRLHTRRFVRTHRRVPTDAARRRRSEWDRLGRSGRWHGLRRTVWRGRWRWDDGLPRPEDARSRERLRHDLDELGVRPLRLRL